MDYENIKTHFKIKQDHGDSCKAVCPAHPDKEASLSISYDKTQGKTIIYCHAGCDIREILDNVGLKMTDLFDKSLDKKNKGNNIEAVYHYRNKEGNILFDKIRFKGKRFTQRRLIKGATVWGLDGGTYYETYPGSNGFSKKKRDNVAIREFPQCKPVIYNLPEVIRAVKNQVTIFLVEGEKDADNVTKLGLVATCNFNGASKSSQKTKWKKEYNKFFKNANVVLIPDNDDPGRAHMLSIAKNLVNEAKSIKILELDGLEEKQDISDWLAKSGNDKGKLQELIHNINEWTNEDVEQDLDLVHINFNPKFLIEGKTKNTVLPVMENIISVMQHYGYEAKYNEINRKVFVFNQGKLINELGDDTIYAIRDKCIIHHLNIPPPQLRGQLYRIAVKNTFNPVRDYLLECKAKWDGNSCLEQLYNTLKCDEISEKFKKKYIRKMLVTAVELVLSKDIANSEGVLVLAGNQGIGKTSWFKSLVPKKFTIDEKQLYFLEGKELELRKKDSLMESTASWFTEIGELSSTFKKSEVDDLKNFITRPSDRFRVPYGVGAKDYRRFTVFVATVNDKEFLKDDSGNRRWWILECKSINYNHNIDMDKIWGEAVYLWETGKETNYFTIEEQKEMQEYNLRYESLDNTTLLIMSYFNFNNELRYWMKASDVFIALNKPPNFNTRKLGVALRKLNLDTKMKDGYKYYAMPPIKDESVYNINSKHLERANYIDMKDIQEISKGGENSILKGE